MELTQAIQIIKDQIASRQKELDTLILALSILENKFAPELKVLENARTTVQSLQTEKAILEDEKISLQADVSDLTGKLTETADESIDVTPPDFKPIT